MFNMENWVEFIFISCFAFLVYLNYHELKKSATAHSLPLWTLPLLGIFILVIPVLSSILILSATFRQLIKIILIVKHGSKFGGILSGGDAFHFTSKRSTQNIINSTVVFQCTKEVSPEHVYENVKLFVQRLQQFEKFTSKVFSCCGYPYTLNKQLTVDDCISKMETIDCQKDKMSKSEFTMLLNRYFNSALPQNNTVPWELVVCTQPVAWKNDNSCNYYPTLFRCDHVLADGITLLEVMVKFFSHGKDLKMTFSDASKVKLQKKLKTDYFTQIKNVLMQMYVCLLFPYFALSSLVVKAKDNNILCGPALSGESFFLFNFEESREYVEKVKIVKNKLGTSFPDVIMAALSAVLNDYFVKKSVKIDYITASVPFVSGSNKLSGTKPEELNLTEEDLQNSFSFLIIKVPVYVGAEDDSNDNMSRRLNFIKNQSKNLKDSLDYQLMMSAINLVCSCLPQPIYEPILRMAKCTAIFSIIPGPPKVYCWQNSIVLSEALPFAPQAYGTGTTLLVNTYDGRLHTTIVVDKVLIPDQEDAQKLADDVLKYIDALVKYADSLKSTSST